MKRIGLIVLCVLALLLAAASLAGWWLLHSDSIEAPALAGRMESATLQHGGKQRSWQLYLPSQRDPRAPLFIVLHGSRGDGAAALAGTFYSFNVLAERKGILVAYPDGYERHWNDCRGSASYVANTGNIDDVGFLRELIATLVTRYDVDPARVYVTGISNGGQMAYRMGLEAPELVAGIAPIVASLPVQDNLDCQRLGQAVATLIINGTEDPINPYDGGLVDLFGDTSRGTVQSAQDSVRYWAELAGYPGAGESRQWPDRDPDDGTTVRSLQWQRPGTPPVALLTVVGGGHTVPVPVYELPRILGRTSHEFDTAEVIWNFFSRGELSVPAQP